MSDQAMDSLRRALDLRASRDAPATFWLRDDDAVEPTPALDQLLGLTQHYRVPVTLAVIPAFSGQALAAALRPLTEVEVAVHGWSHRSFAEPGEKNQELGLHRPREVVLHELGRGFAHLASLHGQQFVPVLVPPWNRIDAALTDGLAPMGFRALSVFGPELPGPIRQINTQVDLIDWRGTRCGKPAAMLVAEIIGRMNSGAPMGFLTHHLVHDADAWQFIDRMFHATADHPGCAWLPLAGLVSRPA